MPDLKCFDDVEQFKALWWPHPPNWTVWGVSPEAKETDLFDIPIRDVKWENGRAWGQRTGGLDDHGTWIPITRAYVD